MDRAGPQEGNSAQARDPKGVGGRFAPDPMTANFPERHTASDIGPTVGPAPKNSFISMIVAALTGRGRTGRDQGTVKTIGVTLGWFTVTPKGGRSRPSHGGEFPQRHAATDTIESLGARESCGLVANVLPKQREVVGI